MSKADKDWELSIKCSNKVIYNFCKKQFHTKITVSLEKRGKNMEKSVTVLSQSLVVQWMEVLEW